MIGVLGFLAVVAWIAWRFGPTLTRVTGWCSWWVAWACGSQGGYGYCVAFLLLGALAWGGGTIWYARRRGRWPSALSARLFARLLGRRNPLTQIAPCRRVARTAAARAALHPSSLGSCRASMTRYPRSSIHAPAAFLAVRKASLPLGVAALRFAAHSST